jgi:hypothetical protein
VASLLNLKDMRQREASPIRCSNWHGWECNLLDIEGVLLVKGHVTVSISREAILDNILGHDHVNLTIFCCPRDISMVMTIGNGR